MELLVRPDIGANKLQRNSVLLEIIKMVQVLPAHGVYVGVAAQPLAEIVNAVFPPVVVVARYFGTSYEFRIYPEEPANILYRLEKELRDIALRIIQDFFHEVVACIEMRSPAVGAVNGIQFLGDIEIDEFRLVYFPERRNVFNFQSKEKRFPVNENSVPLDPPALDEVVVVPNQEQVGSIEELPETDIREKIGLVSGDNQRMSPQEMIRSSLVTTGNAFLSSTTFVTGQLDVRNRPESKYLSSIQSIMPHT